MADQKITQLNENTAPATTDLLALVDDPSGSPETQKITLGNLLKNPVIDGVLNLGSETELTISSGEITVTKSYHTVDTEGDAASDDLSTINGGVEGDILIIKSVDGAREPTAKDGGGNLLLAGDFVFTSAQDMLVLLNYDGSFWAEISRSNNA